MYFANTESLKFGTKMNKLDRLSKREREIAELFAWGASKKEVSNQLFISEHTVANHAQSIFEKTGCTKVNELSALWFCNTYNIPFNLSPLVRRVIAILILSIYLFGSMNNLSDHRRIRTLERITYVSRTHRSRNENNFKIHAA